MADTAAWLVSASSPMCPCAVYDPRSCDDEMLLDFKGTSLAYDAAP